MSTQEHEHYESTVGQVVGVVLGSILLFTLLLSLLAKVIVVSNTPAAEAPAAAVAKVEANIQPVAQVAVAAAEATPGKEKSGEEVYTAVCSACHATGAMEAPKFGDAGMWAPRIAQGYDTLVKNATNGIRMMPAKGGNASLSDKEVAEAVKHMANAGGAKF